MAATIFLKRQMGALRAADRESQDALDAIPSGVVVRAVISRPRNLKHMRKFFALLNAVFPHQDEYATLEKLRKAVICATGFAETVTLPDGRLMLVADSIAFDKMEQPEFDAFYEKAIQLILTRILPGVGKPELDQEVNDIMAGYGPS